MKFIPAIISFFIMGAHFLRSGNIFLTAIFVLIPIIFFIRKKWTLYVTSIFLSFGIILWIFVAGDYITIRISEGRPWIRLMIIFFFVIVFYAFSIFLLIKKSKEPAYEIIQKNKDH